MGFHGITRLGYGRGGIRIGYPPPMNVGAAPDFPPVVTLTFVVLKLELLAWLLLDAVAFAIATEPVPGGPGTPGGPGGLGGPGGPVGPGGLGGP